MPSQTSQPTLAALGLAPGTDLDPAVRAFRTVLTLAHVLRNRMDERLRADGLTTMQAAVLTAVIQLDQPTAAQVTAALGSSKQNVAQLIAALERKGRVELAPDPVDRRRLRISATEASAEYWRTRDDSDLTAVQEWFSAFTEGELRQFTELAARLLDRPAR